MPMGMPVDASTPLVPGQPVEVAWGGEWWRGRVIAVFDAYVVRIHYVGWESSWDENVTRDRLHVVPEPVVVETQQPPPPPQQ